MLYYVIFDLHNTVLSLAMIMITLMITICVLSTKSSLFDDEYRIENNIGGELNYVNDKTARTNRIVFIP